MGTPGADKIKLITEKGKTKIGLLTMDERHQDLH